MTEDEASRMRGDKTYRVLIDKASTSFHFQRRLHALWKLQPQINRASL
jgi:hypothetical protein